MNRITILSGGILGTLLLAPFAGCASSNSHNGFGTGHPEGGVMPHASSSSGGTGSTSGTPGASSGGASSGASGASGASGDDGGECIIVGGGDVGVCFDDVSRFGGVPYVAAVANQGVCAYSDIAAFLTACVTGMDPTACDTWANANLASDAGPGTACGDCIFPPTTNNGPIWFDPSGYPSPNYAACVQVTDTANGTVCATALDNASSCEAIACDACTTQSDADCCIKTVDAAGCSSFASARESSCHADFASGGAFSSCSPGGATNDVAVDYSYIISLLCGSADGG
jgi:hypothetical protein